MESEDNILQGQLEEITDLMRRFPQALEHRSAEIEASGKDPELASKLKRGADVMRDSGNIFLSWAKHYVSMASGGTDASADEDETEDFNV